MFSAVVLSEKGNISGIVIRNRFTKIFNGCPDLGFNYYSLRNLGSLEKCLNLGLGQKQWGSNVECLVVPESEEGLKKEEKNKRMRGQVKGT